jgi:hypothetical protein
VRHPEVNRTPVPDRGVVPGNPEHLAFSNHLYCLDSLNRRLCRLDSSAPALPATGASLVDDAIRCDCSRVGGINDGRWDESHPRPSVHGSAAADD